MATEVMKLPETLIKTLTKKSQTLAVAESCTGGHIADRITDVSGSSAVFLGGVVAYANALKRDLLGVPEAILQDFGSVSQECVCAMALGLYQKTGADYCVAVTGIAGPTGGTLEKPIGTVYIAWHRAHRLENLVVKKYDFSATRDQFKERVTEVALQKIIDDLSSV